MNIYKCIAEDCYQEKYNSFSEDCFQLVIAETRGRAKSIAHSDANNMGGLAYHGEFTDWRTTLEAKDVNYKEGMPEDDSPIWWIGINVKEIMETFLNEINLSETDIEYKNALYQLDNELNIFNQLEMIIGEHKKTSNRLAA